MKTNFQKTRHKKEKKREKKKYDAIYPLSLLFLSKSSNQLYIAYHQNSWKGPAAFSTKVWIQLILRMASG